MTKQLLVSIYSEGSPQSGQKNRSSNNFQFSSLPTDTLEFDVAGNDTPDLSFKVMKDVVLGSDPTIVSGVVNGSTEKSKKFNTKDNYYIANPKNTSDAGFTVKIFAVS